VLSASRHSIVRHSRRAHVTGPVARAGRWLIIARCRRTVFVPIAIFDQHSGQADQAVTDCGSARLLKGDSERLSLPHCSCTGRSLILSGRPGGKFFCHDRLAGGYLGNHGIQLFTACGEPTIGSVVTEPDDGGNTGVVIGEVQGRDASLDAIYQKPGAALPNPMFDLVARKRVVEAQGAANNEAAVCDRVRFAVRPFLDFAIDQKRANAKLLLFGNSTGRISGDGVRNVFSGTQEDDVWFGHCAQRTVTRDQPQQQEDTLQAKPTGKTHARSDPNTHGASG
jgi:hypothetical protein